MSSNKVAKIFAHDAGGANSVFAYAMTLKKQGYVVKAYPKGPAVRIFKTHIPSMIDRALPRFQQEDLIVTGLSGVHSRYELEMIKKARQQGVRKIISILDIPYNIDSRFLINGNFVTNEYLPHKIWTPRMDVLSKNKMISRLLVNKRNPYWDFVKKQHYSKPPQITDRWVRKYKNGYVVFLTEYFKDQHGEGLGYTEFTVLEDFLNTAQEMGFKRPIFIRLHPQEKTSKYNSIIKKFRDLHIVKTSGSLPQFLYYANAIFGILSSVFYESTMINKPSYSLQFEAKKVKDQLPKKVKIVITKDRLKKILKELK